MLSAIGERSLNIKNGEYTGENRCYPCTVVNILIAITLAGAVGVLSSPTAGGVALLIFLLFIYLQGYLVPGTPHLTKTYLPDWVLSIFGKDVNLETANDRLSGEEFMNLLASVGIINPGASSSLVLETDVKSEWESIQNSIPRESNLESVASFIDRPQHSISIEPHDGVYRVEYLGNTIGEWNSKELLQIDLATDLLLDDYIEDWQSYGVAVRADMVHQFRVFLESCPHCNGELTYHQDSMETCCQEYGVIIGECVSCNIEVFKKQASIDT
jgi:hypothetical protein